VVADRLIDLPQLRARAFVVNRIPLDLEHCHTAAMSVDQAD
jgi:hypothetical protein